MNISVETPYTQAEIEELPTIEVKETEQTFYLHCENCVKYQLPAGKSPEEFGNYRVVSTPIELSTGKKIAVVAVFCKRCDLKVWDSRHLTGLY